MMEFTEHVVNWMSDEQTALCVLQLVTIGVTLLLGLINVYLSRRIQKGRGMLEVTTKYRLERMKMQQDAMRRLLVSASPIRMQLDRSSQAESIGRMFDAAAAFETLLHAHFEQDRELIDQTRLTAELAAQYAAVLDSGASDDDLKKRLEKQLKEISRLNDLYTAADWTRIKQETELRNTKAEEWVKIYAEILRNRKELDHKLQGRETVCEKP